MERRRVRLQRRRQVRDQYLRGDRIERCAQSTHDVVWAVLLACSARQDRRPSAAQARRGHAAAVETELLVTTLKIIPVTSH